jgi:uncharacterized integral membrane protein (TIGR00698 family)
VVIVSLAASYAVGRGFGLSRTLALLVACGNSICGNSAIAAVAPIIDAEADDIVSSIAFTAILGVIVVLVLPLLVPLLQLSQRQYGVLAGLTVYAVPQVLAATFPVGILSTQIGTLVKLMRVLMLGPVVLLLSIGVNLSRPDIGDRAAGLRSLGWVPIVVLGPIVQLAALLTVVAMAALGLSVDMRGLRRAGGRVIAAALVAILMLGAISFVLIHWLRIA